MTLRHCLIKRAVQHKLKDCKYRGRSITYEDESGRDFLIVPITTKSECIFRLYNYIPLKLHNDLKAIPYISLVNVDKESDFDRIKTNSGFNNKKVQ